ncbi:hypothetical protein EBS67_15035, partial [bacterium]|nr:hypothetical protein [bacterium]
KQKQRHGRGEEEKTFLPRNDTEKHGIKTLKKEVKEKEKVKKTHPAQWVGLDDFCKKPMDCVPWVFL